MTKPRPLKPNRPSGWAIIALAYAYLGLAWVDIGWPLHCLRAAQADQAFITNCPKPLDPAACRDILKETKP